MFRKILIANRGEIACRIARTARELGVATVAVYSDADADAAHVTAADEAIRIGPASASESYLNVPALIAACKRSGAEAVHPGYGFLSENAEFAEALAEAGIAFIGPPPAAIRAMGLKDAAKRLMEEAGVPVVPGYHGEDQDPDLLAIEAQKIGYPVLIKARAGGGGKGMRRVDIKEEFAEALTSAMREGEAAFGDGRVLIEKFIGAPRHIEIQVFADRAGNTIHLFERDCSLQRRHQKVIEEAPAPGMTAGLRAAMGEAAVRAAQTIGYEGAGTVEFLVDASEGLRADRFYFMEMNTRLQVEHPVTEAITGLDLVAMQLRVAAGEPLNLRQDEVLLLGHAFEARLYAEDPARGFLPATGTLDRLDLPRDIARVDSGVREGDVVSPHYDPMLAKVIVHDATREEALARLVRALDATRIAGTVTNLGFLRALARHPDFAAGRVDTALIDRNSVQLSRESIPTPGTIALAAIAALDLPRIGESPWDSLTGWRAWGGASHRVTLEHREDSIALTVDILAPRQFQVSWAEHVIEVTLPEGAGAAVIDGLRQRSFAKREGDIVSVTLPDDIHRFTVPDPLARAVAAAGGDAITAPMPGLVKQVSVGQGDAVKAGQTLMVLEAMKMEHALKAPRDGIAAQVLAAEGDQVDDGALLVALEALEEGAAS